MTSQPSDILPLSGVFSIDAGHDVARHLALGILARIEQPEHLAYWQIFLPSQRACRSLQAAFLDVTSGQPVILPQMRALGDVDEMSTQWLDIECEDGYEPLRPALDETSRLFILADLISRIPVGGQTLGRAQSLVMAEDLTLIMDQMQQAGRTADGLDKLVPDEFASHWQELSTFLNIIFANWPDILADQHALDPVARQLMLMDRQMEIWARKPPQHPIMIAGSTGSLKKTAQMMKAVLSLPKGIVVLPGLLRDLIHQDDLDAIRSDIGHPQHQLVETTDGLGYRPDQVGLWYKTELSSKQENRLQLMVEVFRPHQQTDMWRRLDKRDINITSEAISGLSVIDCADSFAEADAIAGMMRKTLEQADKTALLVTPDRKLARQVRASLLRWGLDIEDSAGTSMTLTPRGEYLLLLAEWADRKGDVASLLSLCKNRFASGGMSSSLFKTLVRHIEDKALRGVVPARDADEIASLLHSSPEHASLAEFYHHHILAPLSPLLDIFSRPTVSLSEMADAHGRAAEALAQTDIDNEGLINLWQGEDGQSASELLSDISQFGTSVQIKPDEYASIFATLAERVIVRTTWRSHPRLAILGTVEARLQSADLVIMGGVNETSWPPAEQSSAWVNETIRQALGLPDRRWRTGLAAHDFFMLANSPEVVITRSLRSDDSPTTKSRWLDRLDAVLNATKLVSQLNNKLPSDIIAGYESLVPDKIEACAMPAPAPSVSVRPRRFSVTEFDKWIADPYQIYARHILKLRPLEEVDKQPDAALRGSLYHDAIAHFLSQYPEGALDSQALEKLSEAADTVFAPYLDRPQIRYFWRPRFDHIARWLLDFETERRDILTNVLSEKKGTMVVNAPQGPIEIRAKADRLDRRVNGMWDIIDFKTGQPPSKSQVAAGRATQLILEALIACKGGFDGQSNTSAEIASLSYWHLTGKKTKPASLYDVTPDPFTLDEYEDQLARLLAQFDNPAQPYLSEPDPHLKPAFSDYRHLARIREWRAFEVDDD